MRAALVKVLPKKFAVLICADRTSTGYESAGRGVHPARRYAYRVGVPKGVHSLRPSRARRAQVASPEGPGSVGLLQADRLAGSDPGELLGVAVEGA